MDDDIVASSVLWVLQRYAAFSAAYVSNAKSSFDQTNNCSSSENTVKISLEQVRFFFQPRLLYLCSVSDIDHVLPFYYTCRLTTTIPTVRSRPYSNYWPLCGLPSAPKGGLNPSRLVPLPFCLCLSPFSVVVYIFRQICTNLPGSLKLIESEFKPQCI